METPIKKSNKATLIAAALIITGATAVFGTYAAEENQAPIDKNQRSFAHQGLTDEQKAAHEEARELFEAGDTEGGKAILDAAGVKPLRQHKRQEMREEFLESLTDVQKAAHEEARELFEAGDMEGGKAILDAAGITPPRQEKRQEQREAFLESLTDVQKVAHEQAKELRDAGDQEGAKEILDAAGIEPPKNHRQGQKNGQGFGPRTQVNETE